MQTLTQLQSGELTGLTRLKLAEGLRDFPSEIFELADTLEILDLTGNKLSALPDNFAQLRKLRILFLSENQFTIFPAVLKQCLRLEMVGFKTNRITIIPPDAFPPALRWLILTDNQLEALPAEIGNCQKLQKLMLAGNKIKQLPKELAACRNLELLRISANDLIVLPDWLLDLPRLAWLAFAGNPCAPASRTPESLPEIAWQELKTEELIGEGASGMIYKGWWQKDTGNKTSEPVAVKLFKGQVTSDGYPVDEMTATLAAGSHPNIIPVLGKITGHPEQKKGLVLALLPAAYKNLGNPPTFQTCTRDIYPNGTVFTLKSVLQIANGVARAARHLHNQGLMHGDLYAHNILVDEIDEPLLSDFGAATVYGTENKNAKRLELLEVRAFGYLLEDLLNHLDQNTDLHAPGLKICDELKADCLKELPMDRPDFAAICQQLSKAKLIFQA